MLLFNLIVEVAPTRAKKEIIKTDTLYHLMEIDRSQYL
jgi:hypothetical protein